MKLIEPLAAGIRGAEVGSVTLLRRGTSASATYYTDFEFQQQFSASPIALDSNGSAVLYVNELVDVIVRDSNGVIVREFVAGDNATAVEVISQSFTGVDYEDGSSGASKPTTLATVLDRWQMSAGASDFKVLFNGVPTNLQSAFSSTFFNVRAYGAIGNGIADDRTAITTAIAAATTAGGGIVYFPAGVYRVTASFSLPANITLLGTGGLGAKIAVDSAAAAGILTLPGNAAGSISSAIGLWFGAINGANPGVLVAASNISTGEFHFLDCVFGNDALTNASVYSAPATNPGVALKVIIERCYMKINGASPLVALLGGAARTVLRDCDIINTNAAVGPMVNVDGNLLVVGCRFDATANGAAPFQAVFCSPSAIGSVMVIGNYFAPNTVSVSAVAIRNNSNPPAVGVAEFGNVFGDPNSATPGCIPYSFAIDGYAGFVSTNTSHQSRIGRTEGYAAAAAANQAVDPKSRGVTLIKRTAGGNLTVDANKGSMGDLWTLHINNTTGGAITVTGGTNIVFDPAVAPLPINNNGFAEVHLAWLTSAAGVGNWYQVGKAVLS